MREQQREYVRMERRSLFAISIILLLAFLGLIGVSVYSNLRLQACHETQTKANRLLLSWDEFENSTKELFLTYNVAQARAEWLTAKHRFEEDFQAFLECPVMLGIAEEDIDFHIDVTTIRTRWSVVLKRFQEAQGQLETYLATKRSHLNSGNLLVNFGVDWERATHSVDLVNVLSGLRGCVSPAVHRFSQPLASISQRVADRMNVQTKRLRFNSVLLSFLILGIAGLLVVYRMAEMAAGKELVRRHAEELSVEVEERKRAAGLLRSERDKLQSVLNAMGDEMFIVDREFTLEYHKELQGKPHDAPIGSKCFQWLGVSDVPCGCCKAQEAIASGQMQHMETVLDGGRNYEIVFSPFSDANLGVKVVVLMRDITEKKRIEQEAVRTAHLASIGELAAGVAHEINNPINGIINYAERLESQAEKQGLDADIPIQIIKEGDRIGQIVKKLLSFASEREETFSSVCVETVLKDSLALVNKQIASSGVHLRSDLPPDLPMIRARSREIQQVFLNILSNARHALNQKYPGAHDKKVLEIRGRTIQRDGQRFVRVVFHDSGIGIPENVMDKICEPFFSTKAKGEGTGLGLSISHGIITSHGGKLAFESTAGKYTNVVVDLPVSENQV